MQRPATWMTVAIAGAAGVLAGVLLVAILGGPKGTVHVHTHTKTVAHTTTVTQIRTQTVEHTTTVTPTTGIPVPDVIGARLDKARKGLEKLGFQVDVQDQTLFGVIDEKHFVVTDQDPPAGQPLDAGETVTVAVDRG